MNRDVLSVLVAYPQIWHACHTHHPRRVLQRLSATERRRAVEGMALLGKACRP